MSTLEGDRARVPIVLSPAIAERFGPWALIAGAAEGLGAELARQLAAHGLNLALVDRQSDKLESLEARLRADHPSCQIESIVLNLAREDLVDALEESVGSRGIGLLAYNAAHAPIGAFVGQSRESMRALVDVNVTAPVLLAHHFGRKMVERGQGGILLMGSMAGFVGSPIVTAYAASKAFNLILAEGLWSELAAHGVRVLACAPGSTRTPGFESSHPVRVSGPIMEPESVIAEALEALWSARSPIVIPGRLNRAASFLLRHLLPRPSAVRLLGRSLRAMYPQVLEKPGSDG